MKNQKIFLFLGLFIVLLFFVLKMGFLDKTTEPKSEEENVVKTKDIEVVADTLYVPWSMDLLPDGRLLVTERNGKLNIVGGNSILVSGVEGVGEGGLLGLAIHPNFSSNKFIYLYFTTRADGKLINRVVRYTFDGDKINLERVVVDNIPAGSNHNGGRIVFSPDGFLFVTTGDAGNSALAQDTNSLAGKILRVKDDGSIPIDNPFSNAVYSFGHRNPQGLAFDNDGNIWETEHGRSGLQSGYDEVNLITKGSNYGWPKIQGDEVFEGMKKPVMHSGPNATWAPSGIAFLNGKLYFAGLRGGALYEVEVLQDKRLGKLKVNFKDQFGRLRGVLATKDGALLFTTSNQDGRGDPKEKDDKIFKVFLNSL